MWHSDAEMLLRLLLLSAKMLSRAVASPGFCVRGAQVCRREKTENNKRMLYHTRQHCILLSMRYCIRPVCHSHTVIKCLWGTLNVSQRLPKVINSCTKNRHCETQHTSLWWNVQFIKQSTKMYKTHINKSHSCCLMSTNMEWTIDVK